MTQAAPSSYILRNMSEVPNPDTISWFPQTIGWQILALLLVFFLIYKLVRAYCSYRMQRYRQEAKQVLTQYQHSAKRPLVCYDVMKSVFQYLYPNQPQQFNRSWLETLSVDSEADLATELGDKWLRSLLSQSVTLTNEESQQIYDLVCRYVDTHKMPLWLEQYWSPTNTAKRALRDGKRAMFPSKRAS